MAALASQLQNVSTCACVSEGGLALIGGFIITGNAPNNDLAGLRLDRRLSNRLYDSI